ncbi:MAG: hypothetical protein ABEI98_03135 [Halorhabdus sp.]
MNADVDNPGDERAPPVNISLFLGEDGDRWIARDEDTGHPPETDLTVRARKSRRSSGWLSRNGR